MSFHFFRVHKVNGYAVSKEADEALSEFFGKSVRLVRKGPSVRPSVGVLFCDVLEENFGGGRLTN